MKKTLILVLITTFTRIACINSMDLHIVCNYYSYHADTVLKNLNPSNVDTIKEKFYMTYIYPNGKYAFEQDWEKLWGLGEKCRSYINLDYKTEWNKCNIVKHIVSFNKKYIQP